MGDVILSSWWSETASSRKPKACRSQKEHLMRPKVFVISIEQWFRSWRFLQAIPGLLSGRSWDFQFTIRPWFGFASWRQMWNNLLICSDVIFKSMRFPTGSSLNRLDTFLRCCLSRSLEQAVKVAKFKSTQEQLLEEFGRSKVQLEAGIDEASAFFRLTKASEMQLALVGGFAVFHGLVTRVVASGARLNTLHSQKVCWLALYTVQGLMIFPACIICLNSKIASNQCNWCFGLTEEWRSFREYCERGTGGSVEISKMMCSQEFGHQLVFY